MEKEIFERFNGEETSTYLAIALVQEGVKRL